MVDSFVCESCGILLLLFVSIDNDVGVGVGVSVVLMFFVQQVLFTFRKRIYTLKLVKYVMCHHKELHIEFYWYFSKDFSCNLIFYTLHTHSKPSIPIS